MIKLINNKELFDQQIINNLENKKLFGLSMSKHIDYALSNQLEQTYGVIRKHFLNGNFIYNERKKIEEYVEFTKDTSILKDLCVDNENYMFWSSIDLMIKLDINKSFCIDKAIEYLESEKERFKIDALKVLIELNDANAFSFILKSLRNGLAHSFHGIVFSKFNNIDKKEDLIELFDLIYNKEIDQFESSYYREFYKTIIVNLSITDEDFTQIQAILNKIKQSLIKTKSDLFYINLLIDDSINNHTNSKSKPYNLRNAKKKAFSLIS